MSYIQHIVKQTEENATSLGQQNNHFNKVLLLGSGGIRIS
jgi:hypothetical protein